MGAAIVSSPLPTALYIHVPWCVRKCPYCDFNSHTHDGPLPEAAYAERILADLDWDLAHYGPPGAPLRSIFFGGGTPSLLAASTVSTLLNGVRGRVTLAPDCEITLEANPGTAEAGRFRGYRAAGVNRLSLGVQSFSPRALGALGRIHSGDDAQRAIELAQEAGFERLNLDLMHGLPGQSAEEGLQDIRLAIASGVTHLSYYQLTIEPNTAFYRRPPTLPEEALLETLEVTGQAALRAAGFEAYEISAWAKGDAQCRHNLNYWRFGDYFGLGPGAHGKLSRGAAGGGLQVVRTQRSRVPSHWLEGSPAPARADALDEERLREESLLNVLRLREGVPLSLFEAHTGLPASCLEPERENQIEAGLLQADTLAATDLGWRFLNPLLTALAR